MKKHVEYAPDTIFVSMQISNISKSSVVNANFPFVASSFAYRVCPLESSTCVVINIISFYHKTYYYVQNLHTKINTLPDLQEYSGNILVLIELIYGFFYLKKSFCQIICT